MNVTLEGTCIPTTILVVDWYWWIIVGIVMGLIWWGLNMILYLRDK